MKISKELKISNIKLEKVLTEVKTFKIKSEGVTYKVNTVAPNEKIKEAIQFGKLFKFNAVKQLVKWLNCEGFNTTIVQYEELEFEL